MILFAIPIILTSVLQLLYTSADLIIVKIFSADGENSSAAIGSNGALINLIINTFVGLSVGANVAMGNAKGANDKERGEKILHSAMIISLISGLFCLFLGIFFDIIGVAVTVANEEEFHAKATKKVKGSKASIQLIRNAPKVANICADVIGDICGVLSGAISALIAVKITDQFGIRFDIQFMISALVSALTVGGKALGKGVANKNATKIVHTVGIVLNKLKLNK